MTTTTTTSTTTTPKITTTKLPVTLSTKTSSTNWPFTTIAKLTSDLTTNTPTPKPFSDIPENNFIGGGVELLSRIPVNKDSVRKKGKPSFSFFKPSLSNNKKDPEIETKLDIIKDSVRTTPAPDVYVDGFIVGNIPSGNGENLVRNDDGIVGELKDSSQNGNNTVDGIVTTYQNAPRATATNYSGETPKRPDFANWAWMDKDKKQQLANMESLIITSPKEEEYEDIEDSVDHEHHDHHDDHNDHGSELGHDHDHHGDHANHHPEHHLEHSNHEHGDHSHHPAGHMDHHGEHHGSDHHGHHTPHFEGQVSAIFNPLPDDYLGLESSNHHLSRSEKSFVDINNELGFKMYQNLLKKEEYKTKNLIFSPLSTSTMLAMVFLGARGTTSWEMNSILKLDEMISFNPHLMYKNVTDTLMENQNDFSIACIKQLWVDEVTNQFFF